MQRNELLQYNGSIIRILEIRENEALIIDCLHQSMPGWIRLDEIADSEIAKFGSPIPDYEDLDRHSRSITHRRFTMIAGILPLIGDIRQRSAAIARISGQQNISRQTLRRYLWLYLAHQSIAALAPKQKTQPRPFSPDEKNMRWALNKFFYTRSKNSLTTAYTLMLKEKYCDTTGNLLEGYPSFVRTPPPHSFLQRI